MTPEELRTICEQNGGQAAVARLIPCTKGHMSKMCCGIFPIPDKTANHIRLVIKSLQK
jgi:hypothetical protein